MRAAIFVFPGFQILDLTGPGAVFGAVSEGRGEAPQMITLSVGGGAISASCGITVESKAYSGYRPRADDILLVAGGDGPGLRDLMRDGEAGDWFVAATRKVRRHGSICSGAFVLGAWGLLDGKRAATHWRSINALASRFPSTTVDSEAVYVEDGKLWTSAGVTAGIDMALAMVQRDHGARLANAIAKRFVLSVRRAGYQSQYSSLLGRQEHSARYADLIGFIGANPKAVLSVEALAERCGQTPRTFQRHFSKEMGITPAAYVLRSRLECARTLLSEGASVKTCAARSGFSSPESMSGAFRKAYGLSPAVYRANNSA